MAKYLEPINYLETLLHEYDSLQDEIRSRTNIRYGVIGAFTVGVLGTLKMLFSNDTDLKIQGDLLNYFVFLFFIPSLWFIAMTLQIIMIIQIERLGKAIVQLEYKVEFLFKQMGCAELKLISNKIENYMKEMLIDKNNKKIEDIENIQFSLGDPMIWQRLLMSRKRFWDNEWFRIGLPLLLPIILSSPGIFLLGNKLCWPLWKTIVIIIIIYIPVAFIIFRITCSKRAFGGLENIAIPKKKHESSQ